MHYYELILANAFRGELVTIKADLVRCEDRDFEYARALLERMKAKSKID